MSIRNPISPYRVNVRKDGKKFVLYNYDNICGDRLIKGPGFPFRTEGWNTFAKLKDAEAAAERLQKYLDSQKEVRE